MEGRILLALRYLVGHQEVLRVTERRLGKFISEKITEEILFPMKGIVDQVDENKKRKLLSNINEIERNLKSFNWLGSKINDMKRIIPWFNGREEDIITQISDKFEDDIRGRKWKLPSAILKKNKLEDISWSDIENYWKWSVTNKIKDLARVMRREVPTDIHKTQDTQWHMDEEFVDEVIEDEISKLERYVKQKAKNPEEAKVFGYLLKAMIDNDEFTLRGGKAGKKKFVGILRQLPKESPERDNERFWRALWGKMRIHVCSFFKSYFDQQGTRMTNEQKQLVCASLKENITNRIVASEIRIAMAKYVLGTSNIKDELLLGTYQTPEKMVAEIRNERKKEAMINRIIEDFTKV